MNLLPLSPQRYARALRRHTPDRVKRVVRRAIALSEPTAAEPNDEGTNTYADLYEQHTLEHPPAISIGGGDFDRMGRIELAILVEAGLTPTSTLLDFGCGTGRLGVHAIPYLSGGRYIGTDISPTMLVHAKQLVIDAVGSFPSNAQLVTQLDEHFPATSPVDMLSAYSVFTHMEHEDTYRYLRSALDISTPDTTFVASVLQLELDIHQHTFLVSASKTVDERWGEVRNVVSSRDLFTAVAELAGWSVLDWFPASGPAATMPDGEPVGLGQSVVVMRPIAAT